MLPKEKTLTIERLKEVLRYNPVTGKFTWLVGAKRTAGSKTPAGYIIIGIDNVRHQAHRLAWFYCYGIWPTGDIDHKDGVTCNNSIKNLRDSTKSQNLANNKRKPGRHGKGVCRWGRRFAARIRVDRNVYMVGVFDTPEDAAAAYIKASIRYHGEYSVFNCDEHAPSFRPETELRCVEMR